MKNLRQLSLAAAIAACSAAAPSAFAEGTASITEALKDGDVVLSFRMRYEDVTVENPGLTDGTADVLSLKTRLTFTSKDFKGFGLGLEMDDVTHITELEPKGVGAGITDPEGTEVNQYFLSYKFGKSVAKYGRNRIILDNQRFVGGVGFRQNEQTYDSFLIQSNDIDKLSLFGAYVTSIKRIFGEQNIAGEHDTETLLMNAKYAFAPAINLTGYYYDIDNLTAPAMANTTMGVRATGAIAGFGYEAEIANQTDAGENTSDYSASYLGLMASYTLKPVALTLGYESLGTDDAKGRFITPLATLHAFQGWTDVFLGGGTGNVVGGIDNVYFKVAGKAGPVNLAAVYHQFDANDSAIAGFDSFGSEIGFLVAGTVKGIGLEAKYASFSADDSAIGYKDTQKIWLTASASF